MRTIWTLIPVICLLCSCMKDENDTDQSIDNLGEFNTRTIMHDGINRTYHMYLPTTYNTSMATPLVFALHGGGGTGINFEEDVSAGTLMAAAESRGIILITPEGIDKRWNDGRTEIFDGETSYDDVGFISSIIDAIISKYNIDQNRIYSTGISNGGFMSMRLAMDLSSRIAAIAPVTAQITEAAEFKVPEFPISIMMVNGEDDPIVPYYGGCIEVPLLDECGRGLVLSTEASISKLIGYNQCVNPAITEPVFDNVPSDNTSIEITSYKDCEEGTEVVLVKVIGGGHTWPSGAQYLPAAIIGKVSREINASEMILDFFLNHSLN